ncbi:MAG: hypothetical protein ACKO3B_09150 [Bacteroidota bacterium]
MQDKFNQEKVRRYAEAFTAAVLDAYFSRHQRIDGPGLLNLSPVQQVNLFVIRDLMAAWNKETSALRSPYFDFNAPAVIEAFSVFRNVLSNHISIGRADLEPLVRQAVKDTLLLILSPYDYYAEVLDTGGQGKVSIDLLRSQVRHLRINKAPLEQLLRLLEENKEASLISGREAFARLDQVLESAGFSPEDPGPHLEAFAQVSPVVLTDFFDVARKPAPHPAAEPRQEQVQKKSPVPVQTSLYDELGKESRPTLADNFQKQKIGKLRDHLSINQKFMYTKILFNGDFELFGKAIDRLDMMDNLAQAEKFIDMNYPEWDRASEEYEDFRLMLEKRFQ